MNNSCKANQAQLLPCCTLSFRFLGWCLDDLHFVGTSVFRRSLNKNQTSQPDIPRSGSSIMALALVNLLYKASGHTCVGRVQNWRSNCQEYL